MTISHQKLQYIGDAILTKILLTDCVRTLTRLSLITCTSWSSVLQELFGALSKETPLPIRWTIVKITEAVADAFSLTRFREVCGVNVSHSVLFIPLFYVESSPLRVIPRARVGNSNLFSFHWASRLVFALVLLEGRPQSKIWNASASQSARIKSPLQCSHRWRYENERSDWSRLSRLVLLSAESSAGLFPFGFPWLLASDRSH